MGTNWVRFRIWMVGLLGMAMVAAALPAGGTFSDDDGNVHEANIEAIAAEGITKGCNPPTNDEYCPVRIVTREEMAAFLVRALGLTDPGVVDFVDDDGSVFEDQIEKLAAAGITKGCNPPVNDRFCPTDPVTREQMAAFLVRALGLTDPGVVDFVDDDGSVFEDQIEKLAAAGITKGCNPPVNDRFCPTDPVRRDQMASFLGRALGLAPIVAAPFGGEIVVGTDSEPLTLNPFAPEGDDVIVTDIGEAYFGGVYDVDGETNELVPDLVTELPTVTNGGVTLNGDGTMTVSYTIRPDAVWSDGVPVSGTDFDFTMETILDPGVPVDPSVYEDVVSTTVEAKRYELTLASPTMLYEFLFPLILPEHAVSGTDLAADWNDTMWPSAGPYVFDSWDKGEQLRVIRNPRYWVTDPTSGRALPFLDSLVFEFIPSTDDLVSAFQARSVDVVEPPPIPELADLLASVDSPGAVVDAVAGPIWEHLNFQFGPGRLERNPTSPNQSVDYRKAVAHAVDRQLIADEVWGGWAEPLDSFLDVATPSFSDTGWGQYDYNVATAQAYIANAETDLGVDRLQVIFTTTANNDARVRLAELLVSMMDDIGVEFENQLEDSMFFFGETLDRGLWDLGSWAWVAMPGYSGAADLLELFDPDMPPPDGGNYYRWGSPDSSVVDADSARYAEIVDLAEGEVDQRVLLLLIQEAERILADNMVIIPLYARPVFLAYWADEVGGMSAAAQSFTWNIGEWYRLDF